MNSTTMQEIDDMIDSLPNPKMADGYTKDSRAATKSQLNATANSQQCQQRQRKTP